MPTITERDHFAKAIQRALEEAVAASIDEAVEKAKADVELGIRQHAAAIAASLFQQYSMERIGPDIVIRVKIDGGKGGL